MILDRITAFFKTFFLNFFSLQLVDVALIFGVWIDFDKLYIIFEFCSALMIFD